PARGQATVLAGRAVHPQPASSLPCPSASPPRPPLRNSRIAIIRDAASPAKSVPLQAPARCAKVRPRGEDSVTSAKLSRHLTTLALSSLFLLGEVAPVRAAGSGRW